MKCDLRHGDCLEVLKSLPDCSVDSVVTDPPAGIGFMGKEWDDYRRAANPADIDRDNVFGRTSGRGPEYGRARAGFMAMVTPVMAECLRVLKPGGHALVWAIPRTSHWTATAVEDAGFEIRDIIDHYFATGFPKSLDVRKAIEDSKAYKSAPSEEAQHAAVVAFLMDGWGTALKPAHEHWILARKPLDGTVATNVIAHGTGGINIDDCRIGGGRWPANVILSHSEFCQLVGEEQVPTSSHHPAARGPGGIATQGHAGQTDLEERAPKTETVARYRCVPGCPVAELDRQSGDDCGAFAPVTGHEPEGDAIYAERGRVPGAYYGDSGGASRFFFVPKPDTGERERGLGHMKKASGGEATSRKDGSAGLKSPRAGAGRRGGRANVHPTVKPVALMKYLVRLVTPRGGVVLDPFMGSGTTGIAALQEGMSFIGIDKDASYVELARSRIDGDSPLWNRMAMEGSR